jgi:predicted DNA-binding protein
MSRKKVSTTIYITPEQADRLKLLHERTKVPISVYIREGIDMMLKHYEPMLPGQMSLEAAPPITPLPSSVTSAAPAVSRREPAATLRTGATSSGGASGGDSAPSAKPSEAGSRSRSGDGGS